MTDDGPPTTGLHIAFQAKDRQTVERFHEAAWPQAGRTTAPPASATTTPATTPPFVLDPDGTNVEAVYHGPVERSADSVVFTWEAS